MDLHSSLSFAFRPHAASSALGQTQNHDAWSSDLSDGSSRMATTSDSASDDQTVPQHHSQAKPRSKELLVPHSSSSSSPGASAPVLGLPPGRQIKPHRKTRNGCFDCKRRRVKCQETRPACENCIRNGLRCTYPSRVKAAYDILGASPVAPQAQSMKELYSSELQYTALDMLLLQNFITKAHPKLPTVSDDVWTGHLPCVAHQYSFVMHAILALSAAQMISRGNEHVKPVVEYHRHQAMQGLITLQDQESQTPAELDAVVGASLSLAFYSAHMKEGYMSYFIHIRTGVNVSMAQRRRKQPTKFSTGSSQRDLELTKAYLTDRVQKCSLINPVLVKHALSALEPLEHVCRDDFETRIYNILHATLTACSVASLNAYFEFITLFEMIGTMNHEDFLRFTAHSSTSLGVLVCHAISTLGIMSGIMKQEWPGVTGPDLAPDGTDFATMASGDYFGIRKDLKMMLDAISVPKRSPLARSLTWPKKVLELIESGWLCEHGFDDADFNAPERITDLGNG